MGFCRREVEGAVAAVRSADEWDVCRAEEEDDAEEVLSLDSAAERGREESEGHVGGHVLSSFSFLSFDREEHVVFSWSARLPPWTSPAVLSPEEPDLSLSTPSPLLLPVLPLLDPATRFSSTLPRDWSSPWPLNVVPSLPPLVSASPLANGRPLAPPPPPPPAPSPSQRGIVSARDEEPSVDADTNCDTANVGGNAATAAD